MLKEKLRGVRDFLIKNSKIAFPVILTVAVALTVVIALKASDSRQVEELEPTPTPEVEETQQPVEDEVREVPLVLNEDEAIEALIENYYNAQVAGDVETLVALCDAISEKDQLLYQETSRYLDVYRIVEIYTKPGYAEGETIAYVYFMLKFVNHDEELPGYQTFYVCTAGDGSRYIMRGDVSEEANQYCKQVSEQDDVVEFVNRIEAEYYEFKEQHPDMANYPEEVTSYVRVTVGEILSAQQAEAEKEADQPEGGEEAPEQETPIGTETKYATAVTTVNVRSSDSEKADKLGKVTGGTKLEVLEERVNGWTMVSYEGKEGFIKSEFLQVQESVAGLESIGSVTANTNINVRASASQSAEKLGVLKGGDSAELVAVEGDWCKIKYNGQVGYVKSEYVQR